MEKQMVECSLTDLMGVLSTYADPIPVYVYTITVPECIQFGRADKAPVIADGQPVLIKSGVNKGKPKMQGKPCPYLHPTGLNERGLRRVMIVKHSKMLVRLNDDYEQAVQRRQLKEAYERGEAGIDPDDLFVAEHPTWGANMPVEKDVKIPPLFIWWIPKYTSRIKFYMACRPVQCQQVWYEWNEGPAKGQRLSDEEVAYAKDNYFNPRDEEAEADRQEVEKAIPWRKITFDNILEMTVGGIRYRVIDATMPECPPALRDKLLAMLETRVTKPEETQETEKTEKTVTSANESGVQTPPAVTEPVVEKVPPVIPQMPSAEEPKAIKGKKKQPPKATA